MGGSVLVLGASGRFGRNACETFSNAGWKVRAFDRNSGDLMREAEGVDVIVNAWNPPYPEWVAQVPELHARVRKAALATGATVLVPGNVYVFGPTTPSPWSEASPHKATNTLGRIRTDMEAAYRADGVKTIVLRAGDFLDTRASGNWFDLVMTKKLAKGIFTYPGNPEISHAWAFLPDLCRAAVQLAEMRDRLEQFVDVPFPGYTLTGQQICQSLSDVTDRPVRLEQMNWLPLQLARPFWPMARYLLEMRYLWNLPHELAGDQFDRLLPDFRKTALQDALRVAIQSG